MSQNLVFITKRKSYHKALLKLIVIIGSRHRSRNILPLFSGGLLSPVELEASRDLSRPFPQKHKSLRWDETKYKCSSVGRAFSTVPGRASVGVGLKARDRF